MTVFAVPVKHERIKNCISLEAVFHHQQNPLITSHCNISVISETYPRARLGVPQMLYRDRNKVPSSCTCVTLAVGHLLLELINDFFRYPNGTVMLVPPLKILLEKYEYKNSRKTIPPANPLEYLENSFPSV